MPIIFSTSTLALPGTLARFTGLSVLKKAALALNPGGKMFWFTDHWICLIHVYYLVCKKDLIFGGKNGSIAVQLHYRWYEVISSLVDRIYWYYKTNKWDFLRFVLSANQHPFDSLLQLLLHIPTIGSRWCEWTIEAAGCFDSPRPSRQKYSFISESGNSALPNAIISLFLLLVLSSFHFGPNEITLTEDVMHLKWSRYWLMSSCCLMNNRF